MRDKHDEIVSSISPPPKKSKIMKSNSVESMEIEEEGEDKSEDMEIDSKEAWEMRSRKWDEKIEKKNERQRKAEELEVLKKKTDEEKNKQEEIKKLEDKKKMKQSVKNKRKRSVKKKEGEEVKLKNPKIKEVPKNCKHLVKDDDVIYSVPGDGCCGPNCAAVFLFHDEAFGPRLRRKMNLFQAEHWFRRYQEITPCSPDHPFERKLNGNKVSFTDPKKLIKFLKFSKEAAFMWSDSEDLAVIADLFQVRIKIITTRGSEDKNPTENWIYPDEKMKEFAELRNVILDEMILFHENDSHFNLIISKDHDLAVFGSLSQRLSETPLENSVKEDKIYNKEEENKKSKTKDIEEELTSIKIEYEKCVRELRNKTEEAEILKTEIKDLKEILNLREVLKANDDGYEEETLVEMKRSGSRRTSPQFQSLPTKKEILEKKKDKDCQIRGFESIGKKHLNKHVLNHTAEPEFNCESCDFQGTEEDQLNKHVNLKHTAFCKICKFQCTDEGQLNRHIELKHTVKSQTSDIECRICGETFIHKWEFMDHRKKEHEASVAICENNLKEICKFSSARCWWRHAEKQNGDSIQCFVCGESFKNRGDVMVHRKKKHPQIVKPCNNYEGNCRFKEESCWFKHKNEEESNNDEKEEIEDELESVKESHLVFRTASKKKEPPLKNH